MLYKTKIPNYINTLKKKNVFNSHLNCIVLHIMQVLMRILPIFNAHFAVFNVHIVYTI